jgi:hypothetical protein
MAAKDSESFGETYPPNPGKNSTIITFQNIGSQRFSLYHQTSAATSRAFKDSQPSWNSFIRRMQFNRITSPSRQQLQQQNENTITQLLLKTNKQYQRTTHS